MRLPAHLLGNVTELWALDGAALQAEPLGFRHCIQQQQRLRSREARELQVPRAVSALM